MKAFGYRLFLGLGILIGMTVLTLWLTYLLLGAPLADLMPLAGFLLISGGITVALGLAAARFGMPRRMGSFGVKLALVAVFTTVLMLGNVGFTALLMFLSGHDLALLAVLLGCEIGIPNHAYATSTLGPVLDRAAQRDTRLAVDETFQNHPKGNDPVPK